MTYTLHTHATEDGNGEDRYVPLAAFSAAIDEVYALRAALAYEALVTGAHLAYATFPKSRRRVAEAAMRRSQAAARGDVHDAYLAAPDWGRKGALREAGADDCLTNHQWWEQWEQRTGAPA